jgi:hypothetical protein
MSSLATPYLGNPLSPQGLLPLSVPPPGASVGNSSTSISTVGVTVSVSRTAGSQSLISGGTATLRKRYSKSSYQIGWSMLLPQDFDTIMSFFDGGQGGGPYCFIDPSQYNFFPPNVCRMGQVVNALPEWSPTAGTLAVSSTLLPPTGFMSGVATWTSAATGSILYTGLNNVVDGTWLPPVVPGLSIRASIWAKLTSGTATLTAAMMYGVGGSAPAGTAATGSAVTLNTSTWQEVSVAVASSFSWGATVDYAMPKFTVSSASSPVFQLSAPSFVYDTVTNASALNPWVGGMGVPRVVIPADAQVPVDLIGVREFTLNLQEA